MRRYFQNINFLRLVFFLFFILIFFIKINMLFVYTTVFYLSFEFLNANQRFRKMRFRNYYNVFIVLFVSYILLVRSEVIPFSEAIVFQLNTLEHVLFALIICLHLSIYIHVLKIKISNDVMQLILIVAAFNSIGLANEYFQNGFNGNRILFLAEDNTKDLFANLLGTVLYAALILFHKKSKALFLANE